MEEIKYTDDELREMGWKRCNSCEEMKPPEQYYKSARRNNLSYSCKPCHRKIVRSYRKVEGSYAYWYKRLERVRNSAKKRGLECTLTVQDIREIKESPICEYCKAETDLITLDRLDNDRGYVRGNIVPACYLCNKLKSTLPFDMVEMEMIGRAVRRYYKRENKKKVVHEPTYGVDYDIINEIANS